MRRTPPEIEIDILARLLNGESYEEVTDGRVWKSTVNRIVNSFQEKCPDFWDLRELNIKRKKANITFSDIVRNVVAMTSTTLDIDKIIVENRGSPAAQYLDWLLANQCTYIPCKNCGDQIRIPLQLAKDYAAYIQNNMVWYYVCSNCGHGFLYTPFEILGHLALKLLK
jgi:hypothetical protein